MWLNLDSYQFKHIDIVMGQHAWTPWNHKSVIYNRFTKNKRNPSRLQKKIIKI